MRVWLERRAPKSIGPLARRLERAVRAHAAAAESEPDLPRALAAIAVALLGEMRRGDPRSTELGLDLLAADALVTYAFEAAADRAVPVVPLAERIVSEVSR